MPIMSAMGFLTSRYRLMWETIKWADWAPAYSGLQWFRFSRILLHFKVSHTSMLSDN